MSDKTEDEQSTLNDSSDDKGRRPRRRVTDSTSASDKEPTQDGLGAAASAKPATARTRPYAVVSGAEVDNITYSRAVPTPKNGPRRSMTVWHIQRALHERGFVDAWSDNIYGPLTRKSVSEWQESRGEDATGVLTRDQFADLFKDDPNVELTFDTIEDHPAE